MAIVTDQTITIHGVSVGISKPIQTLIANGDFTFDELSKFAIVGRHDFVNDKAGVFAPDTYSYMAGSAGAIAATGKYPICNDPTAPNWNDIDYVYLGKGEREYDNYGKMVLVYNMASSVSNINKDFNDSNTACIVTEFNPRLIKMIVNISEYSKTATVGDVGSYTTYDPEASRNFVWMDDDTSAPFASLCIQHFDDAIYFSFPLYNNVFTTCQNISGNRDSMYVSLDYIFDDYMQTGDKLLSVWCDGGIDDFLTGANYANSFVGIHDMSDDRGTKVVGVEYTAYPSYSGFGYTRASDLDTVLKQCAACGCYFEYNNTVYKPITTDGIVTDYTADLSKNGEWDLINDVTGNTIPDTPGGGGGGGDDDPSDDQASGGIYGGAQGMCNLYYMTAGEIKDLQNWFRGTVFSPGIQIPGNFDPSDQLIGLMAFPIELGGSVDNTTITFRTADNQSVDTGVSCQKAYGDDLKFDMGTIDIPARMAQRGVPFLDYSCQIEVYIPFCDVVQLDVQQVIGTTLTCEMWINPATGDVSAMLSSGTHPVAYTSGNCAQQLPISVSSYGAIAGAKLAAGNKTTQTIFSTAQNIIKDITNAGAIASAIGSRSAINSQGMVDFQQATKIQSNLGIAGAAGVKAAGTGINTALALTAQSFDNKYALQVAKNSAPTHVSGSFGACTSWHFPNYCYVKITRPHFKKPDNYGHTEAVPVIATKQLSSLSGLTTCVNPDVSGIGTATMQELETIKSYLMSGVIL